MRVTGRHEAGSEHCPSAAILPGDRASHSSQWGARGAVVLTYHAGEPPLTQSETDTGSDAAIQRAGRGAGPNGESERRAPRSLLAVPASAQSWASAGKCLTNRRRGGFRRTTRGRTANQKVRPARRVGRAGQSAPSLGGVLNFWWELWFCGDLRGSEDFFSTLVTPGVCRCLGSRQSACSKRGGNLGALGFEFIYF